MSLAKAPQRAWTKRLVDWTFGEVREPSRFHPASSSAPMPERHADEDAITSAPRVVPETIPVWVEQNARSPLEAFKDAITDGTRLFCEQNVHPLHMLDQSTMFRVTGIQMYVPRDKTGFLQVLEKLPIDVRNRMTRILVMAAPGAEEQLVIDEGFFGLSLDIEPTVIDGHTIRLIAAWSRDSAEVKLVFSGQYMAVELKPRSVQGSPVHEVSPAIESEVAVAVERATALPCRDAATDAQPLVQEVTRSHRETPLGLPRVARPMSADTPLAKPSSRQIALIRYQYAGQQHETTVAITQDMLPFVIGREHTSSGRFDSGLSLADPKDANLGLLVSREHLELSRFEPESGTFYLVNHGHSRNGSYHLGSALSERFMLKGQAPNNVIHLGGSGGVGTVRIVIEAA